MKSPVSSLVQRAPRRSSRRAVNVLGKSYLAAAYRPQFALGILCGDEGEQRALFDRLGREFPSHEIKVLVI